MVQRHRKTVPRTANPRSELERPSSSLRLASQPLPPPPELGRRIFALVCDKPFHQALPSLGMVIACLLLTEARDPVEAVDDFAVLLRQLVVDARRKGLADAASPN
jgi:hypothetical protein